MAEEPVYEVSCEELEDDKWTPLHEAAYDLDLTKIRDILTRNLFPVNGRTREEHATPLHFLCDSGDRNEVEKVEAIRLLVAHGADLNVHRNIGDTPLHAAAQSNQLRVAQVLVELGANVNTDKKEPEREHGEEGGCGCGNAHALQGIFAALTGGKFKRSQFQAMTTPLHQAARSGHAEMAKLLLDLGAKVDAFDNSDGTPLHCAAMTGSLECCKILFEAEGGAAAMDVKDNKGQLPIHCAAYAKDPEILKYILEKHLERGGKVDCPIDLVGYSGEDPNNISKGKSPLALVAEYSYDPKPKNASILLDAGADPNFDIGKESTPLLEALNRGNNEVARVLLARGGDKTALTHGEPPILVAATRGNTSMCELLLELGANVNTKSSYGENYTPLHNAAGYGGDVETIKTLVAHGAEIEARNYDGRVPLHMACFKGKLENAQQLIKLGADIEAEDDNWWTPLHFASSYGHIKVVTFLLNPPDGTVSADAKKLTFGPMSIERTAADLARENGHEEIVRLLLAAGAELTKVKGKTEDEHEDNGEEKVDGDDEQRLEDAEGASRAKRMKI